MVTRAAKNAGGGMVPGVLLVARVGTFAGDRYVVPGGRMVTDDFVPGV
jgi:hypothetical protein